MRRSSRPRDVQRPLRWRNLTTLLALVLLVVLVAEGTSRSSARAEAGPGLLAIGQDVRPFRGLGTWLDVYDYVPGFQDDGGPPPVSPDSIDDMSRLGIRTLYLQSAQDDTGSPAPPSSPRLLGTFLRPRA